MPEKHISKTNHPMVNTNKKGIAHAILTVFFAAVLLPVSLIAQQQNSHTMVELSLEEALERTERENFSVRIAREESRRVQAQYQQSRAAFLPQLSIEETGISTDDPLSVFGFKLKQESVANSDFNADVLNNPDVYENFTTKLQVRQPLLNPDKLYQRAAAKNQFRAAEQQFQSTIQQMRFRVKDTYYRLLLTQQRIEVINRSLEASRENERQAKNLYGQGLISKADFLAAGVRVLELESQLELVQNQEREVHDNLKYLLNIKDDVRLLPADDMSVQQAPKMENLSGAEVHNAKLRALNYQVSAAEEMLKSAKFSFVPSLNVFGSYEFNDAVLFGTQGESYMIGATLKWNLFSGFKNAGKVREMKAGLKQAELAYENQVIRNKLQIEKAGRAVEQSLVQLRLAEASIRQANENFKIRKNRFEQGLERTTDVLAAETKLAEAQLQKLNTLYEHNVQIAMLELLLERKFGS